MKRTKLITSLCTLILTIACLTFGVYSAVKTSFTASGTITFYNYGIDADITIDIYGVENGTAVDSTDENYAAVTGLKKKTVLASTGSSDTARSAHQANVITSTPTLTLGELKFDELNTTVADEWASKIVLVISFTNYSKFDAQLSITQQSAAITNLTATYGSKIKATKSDGTTGVAATSSLTITLTPTDKNVPVSGTFNPQITLQPNKVEMPTKGQLITMDLGSTETVVGLENQYRILNIDGTIAEILAMYDLKSNSIVYSMDYATTMNKDGTEVAKYEDSDLDKYLNGTWYDALSEAAKKAIVENNITQYSYVYDNSSTTYNEETHASYAKYSSKAKVAVLKRNVYALDVEDIEAYFGGSTGDNGKSEGRFSTTDILKLFWDTETKPVTQTFQWFRSANTEESMNACILGLSGQIVVDIVDSNGAARPAFKIDLSKIDWKLK